MPFYILHTLSTLFDCAVQPLRCYFSAYSVSPPIDLLMCTMKHDCPDEQTLWEYLDGELDADAHQALADHLQRCPACHYEAQSLQHLELSIADTIDSAEISHDYQLYQARPCHGKCCNEMAITSPIQRSWKSLVWSVLPLLMLFSMFAALTFVALIVPDLSLLPFSGELRIVRAIFVKFLEFMLRSSVLLAAVFFFLFLTSALRSWSSR